jgi:hypothetical protein
MKTPTALSVTSSQREQTSLRSQAPRLPRSNVCSTPDLENPSASVHRKRFSTPSLTLKFLCAGKLNPRNLIADPFGLCDLITVTGLNTLRTQAGSRPHLSKLAMACREKPEAVVIGTSRIRIGIDPRHPGWGTAAGRAYNLGIPGMGLQEAALTLQHAVYASGRLRLAVVGLDFLMFNANHEALAPETGKVTFDRQRYVVSASGSCAGSFIQ